MTIKQCIQKNGWRVEVDEMKRFQSVAIVFLNGEGESDETEFDISGACTDAGRRNFPPFLKFFVRNVGHVVGTDRSVYEGLYGRITEIRDGEDKETENETLDIYCTFELPVLPYDMEILEKRFSRFTGKRLEDIGFDSIIMAPEMIKGLEETEKCHDFLTIYAVTEDWAANGERGHNETLCADPDAAKYMFNNRLKEELAEGCLGTVMKLLVTSNFITVPKIDKHTLFLYNIMCTNEGVIAMQARNTINLMLQNSPSGTITTKQVTESGVHRGVLQELVEAGDLYRYGRGIYSHDTALYLLGYSDRTPAKYTMTFPKGYNAPSMKQENIIIKRVVPDNYSFGIVEMKSPCGNPVRIYDLERTLCDIVVSESP